MHSPYKRRRKRTQAIAKKYGFFPAWPVIEGLYKDELDYHCLPKKNAYKRLWKFITYACEERKQCAYYALKAAYDKPERLTRLMVLETEKPCEEVAALSLTNSRVENLLRRVDFIYDRKKQWIRSISSFNSQAISFDSSQYFVQLMKHLFAKYTVPDFLCRPDDILKKLNFEWFIHIAQGGNIRTAPQFPYEMSSKQAHYFMQARCDYSLKRAFWYGRIRAYGGHENLGIELSRLFERMRIKESDFWNSVLFFFVNYAQDGHEMLELLLVYIMYRKIENPLFSLKGRTLDSLANEF